jgi:serine/threonine protein phosphatase PrpC
LGLKYFYYKGTKKKTSRQFCINIIGKYFTEALKDNKDIKQLFKKTFQRIEKELFLDFKSIPYSYSTIPSSTAACVYIDRENQVAHIAHLGDSRVLVVNKNREVTFSTKDHNPNNQGELSRIQEKGGEIQLRSNNIDRTVNGLGISRAIGGFDRKNKDLETKDYTLEGKGAIIADCEYNSIKLQEGDQILIFSDGVTESGPRDNNWMVGYESVEKIIKKACENGSVDDITAMRIHNLQMLQNCTLQSDGKPTMERPVVVDSESVAVNNEVILIEPVSVVVKDNQNLLTNDSSLLTKGKVFCFLSVVAIAAVIGILCYKFAR